jgi:hypothetical protein
MLIISKTSQLGNALDGSRIGDIASAMLGLNPETSLINDMLEKVKSQMALGAR